MNAEQAKAWVETGLQQMPRPRQSSRNPDGVLKIRAAIQDFPKWMD
jgi:hypothetical protein